MRKEGGGRGRIGGRKRDWVGRILEISMLDFYLALLPLLPPSSLRLEEKKKCPTALLSKRDKNLAMKETLTLEKGVGTLGLRFKCLGVLFSI